MGKKNTTDTPAETPDTPAETTTEPQAETTTEPQAETTQEGGEPEWLTRIETGLQNLTNRFTQLEQRVNEKGETVYVMQKPESPASPVSATESGTQAASSGATTTPATAGDEPTPEQKNENRVGGALSRYRR